MPKVVVVADGKKFKVLVNFIQRGVSYSTKELAEQEANKLRDGYKENYNQVTDAKINRELGL